MRFPVIFRAVLRFPEIKTDFLLFQGERTCLRALTVYFIRKFKNLTAFLTIALSFDFSMIVAAISRSRSVSFIITPFHKVSNVPDT